MSKIDQSRRDALKKLSIATGVGAVATTEWAKPVVNNIIVPAHAQTTSGSGGSSSLITITTPINGLIDIEFDASYGYSSNAYSVVITVSGTNYTATYSQTYQNGNSNFVAQNATSLVSGTTYLLTVSDGNTYNVTF